MNRDLTWDELAEWYDKYIGGRAARTLPMSVVFDACASRKHTFELMLDGSIRFKAKPKEAA